MSRRNTHALGRAVRRLSVGGAVALERRRAMLDIDKLHEMELQFQIPLSGTVDEGVYWSEATLEFEYDFFSAPSQRDSPLTMPHFTYGAVVSGESVAESNPNGVPYVTCAVVEYVTDAREAVTGARVAVGVSAPDGETEYEGYVHLSFQGFGTPSEDLDAVETDQGVDEDN